LCFVITCINCPYGGINYNPVVAKIFEYYDVNYCNSGLDENEWFSLGYLYPCPEETKRPATSFPIDYARYLNYISEDFPACSYGKNM
jgi:hypothetical protein